MKLRTTKAFIMLAILIVLALAIAVGGTTLALGASENVPWTGNGSENNCENGGTYHWVLTPGGSDISSATLTVNGQNFGPGTQAGQGAFQWNIVLNEEVTSASAAIEYEGQLGNVVLTISSSECNTTTTTEPETTTTTQPETTTTTQAETTTTTQAETTTTTQAGTTTTTQAETTTTTQAETTTTTGAETTTTTEAETTTTTEQATTTSTAVGGETTVPTSATSTTQAAVTSTPRPGMIQTGGGGTAGPGAGVWALIALAGVLATGLLVSTVRARHSNR